jgi:pilus assembly protein FimV
MSEVGTKLDLARAYIDMGDPEGARSILEEVLKEGSANHKQEAERLLAGLP